MITIEQKGALEDIVINIVTPIILWLDFFEKYRDMCPIEKLAEMLKQICLDAQKKVDEFECEKHCLYPGKCQDSTN